MTYCYGWGLKLYSLTHWLHQLWGTAARASLELGHVEKFGSFYMHNILSFPRLQ